MAQAIGAGEIIMSTRFKEWFDWLMKWEGVVYENDPDDPGGATKFGIDQRSHPSVHIRSLTREQAMGIYWREYWGKVRAEELPPKLAEVVGDIAVNNGVSRAIKWLQEVVGTIVDGQIGPKTMKAVLSRYPEEAAAELLDRREKFYRSIAKGRKVKFLRGWLNRNNDLRRFIQWD